MKLAISLPDDLFREVDRRAKMLGVPRSRLIADGARLILAKRRVADPTAAWNAALDAAGQPEDDAAARELRRRSKRAVHRVTGRF